MGRTLLVVSLLALVAGCKKKPEITDVTCEAGDVAGVGKVTWKTELEGQAHVEYGVDDKKLDTSSPGVPAADQEETLLGLKVAQEYHLRVVVDADGEKVESDTIECTTEPPPASTPSFTLVEYNPDLACEDGGYVLFNYLGDHESGVGILDRDGRYVWAVESDSNVQFARARLGRDGKSILWNTNDYDRVDDIATVERLSVDGATSTSTRTLNAHHDFVELPDGSMGFVAYEFSEDVPLTAAFPPPWDNFPTAYDRIYEVPEGATDADVPTLAFDHVADWPEGIYFNDHERCDRFLPGYCELGHANSLAYIEAEDSYSIGFRWLDAIVNTSRTGEVQWVFGGAAGTLTGAPADMHVHAHFSEAWAGGMFVFDNHDPENSRLMEYAIDASAMTYASTWSFASDSNEAILGDVRRVPVEGCDNVLVSWSSQGRLVELTRAGETVWEVSYSLGNITGRAQYLSSLYDFADQAYPE